MSATTRWGGGLAAIVMAMDDVEEMTARMIGGRMIVELLGYGDFHKDGTSELGALRRTSDTTEASQADSEAGVATASS